MRGIMRFFPVMRRCLGRLWMLLPAIGIVVIDQITKLVAIERLDVAVTGGRPVPVVGRLVSLALTQNTGMAFGIGQELPEPVRRVLFVGLPVLVVIGAIGAALCVRTLSALERIAIALVVGGGVGNLIDRIWRPAGVIDFIRLGIDLFGRTYASVVNGADIAITVGGVLFVIGILRGSQPETEVIDP